LWEKEKKEKKRKKATAQIGTLTLGWTTLFIGETGEGALHEEERNVKQRKLKCAEAGTRNTSNI
jgi:hypothetical protein